MQALITAASEGHLDCARLLLDIGADMDASDVVCVIPIATSSFFCFYVLILDFLPLILPCVLCSFDVQGHTTALMGAAQGNHVDCLRFLIEAGANTDLRDKVRLHIHQQPLTCPFSYSMHI